VRTNKCDDGKSQRDSQQKAGLGILSIERKTVVTYFVKGDEVIISNIFHGGRGWEAFFLNDKIDDGEG